MMGTEQDSTPGAAPRDSMDWHAIDWPKAHRIVRRLQARIVKATQEGRWGKVNALQRLLTHSLSGKVLAVKRVTENHGKCTPGVDRVTWNTPQRKASAIQALRQHGYRARPLRRVYIPKSNGKQRPLGIPTMVDRAMQALYLLALDPIAETLGDPNSYGFRPGRAPADAIEQAFVCLSSVKSGSWVLEGDIRGCFDHISHDWLLAHIPMDKAILRAWLKAGCIEQRQFLPTEEGTPQGGIISPVLANLTLDGLERRLRERFPTSDHRKGQGKKQCVNFIRFADDLDDFIITGKTRDLLEQEVRPLVETFLLERGLELSPEKTLVTHIEAGFDFLGQHFQKYQGKLLITPAAKGQQRFLDKVRQVIKAHPTAMAGHLITLLNPILRGWANYHRHICSKEAFVDLDHAIFEALWRWAKRRHPKKGLPWIKRKYFCTIGGNHWVFCGTIRGRRTEPRRITLYRLAQTAIKRHVKIRNEANPYDPRWEEYFQARRGVHLAALFAHRREIVTLWTRQRGICPVCHQPIVLETGWDNHHVIWRSKGGEDDLDNRVLLHPNCHRQVHAREKTEVTPRSERSV
jgi:RNA-directed DNA polymerase